MAATDYEICAGVFNLYFAKKTKGPKISEDRRVITREEILAMAEWLLRNDLENYDNEESQINNTIWAADKEMNPIAKMKLLDTENQQKPDTIWVTKEGKPIFKMTLLDTQ